MIGAGLLAAGAVTAVGVGAVALGTAAYDEFGQAGQDFVSQRPNKEVKDMLNPPGVMTKKQPISSMPSPTINMKESKKGSGEPDQTYDLPVGAPDTTKALKKQIKSIEEAVKDPPVDIKNISNITMNKAGSLASFSYKGQNYNIDVQTPQKTEPAPSAVIPLAPVNPVGKDIGDLSFEAEGMGVEQAPQIINIDNSSTNTSKEQVPSEEISIPSPHANRGSLIQYENY